MIRFRTDIHRHVGRRPNRATTYSSTELVLIEGITTKERGYYLFEGYPAEGEIWEVYLDGGNSTYWNLNFKRKIQ